MALIPSHDKTIPEGWKNQNPDEGNVTNKTETHSLDEQWQGEEYGFDVVNNDNYVLGNDATITSADNLEEKLAALTGRWAGTKFQGVAESCKMIRNWSLEGKDIGYSMVDWLSDNTEGKLVDEAMDIMEGIEERWKQDGIREEYKEMLTDAVEIMTAIDSLKNPAEANSYRAIAGSSLLLKLFDQVILVLWGHLLSSDSLQFGYKAGFSTTQCTWLVMEVASYFLRKGTPCIVTLLDCTKAFDKCKFDILFGKLVDRNVPAVVIRVLLVVYEEQYAWVKWGKSRSRTFGVVNGT